LGVDEVLTNPGRKTGLVTKRLQLSRVWTDIVLWYNLNNGKGKGKAMPLQAWRDPEGFRRLRLPDFKTAVA
jgi:hypothetical protein